MRFRPCIDLHEGKVVQIVGSSLLDNDQNALETNFIACDSAAAYASRYQTDDLYGGHVISLGEGNRDAAISALKAFPGGMQYGGGVNPDNAGEYIQAGASHVIVTSWVFLHDRLSESRLENMRDSVGREKLVLDLSCRKKGDDFYIVTNRWQTFTEEKVSPELLLRMSEYCAEYLVHGVDVEGKRQGIQEDLIRILAEYSPIPVTYAGGVHNLSDLELVKTLGQGRVDLTIGSALDIFGGQVAYQQVVEWSKNNSAS